MDRTFATPEPCQLYVELGAGRVTLTATDTAETQVRVTGPRAEEFVVEQSRAQIEVIAPKGRFFGNHDQHDVRVTLPTDSGLFTRLGSADLTASGCLGTVKIKTGSGDLTLEETSGPTIIETGSGDLRAVRLRADTRLKSGSGDLTVAELGRSTAISTGSGDIAVERTGGALVVKTGSGDVHVGETADQAAFSTGSGDIVIERTAGGKIVVKGASGDVTIGVVPGTPVWTDVNSVSGEVRSTLPSTGKPADGQGHVELRVTTVSGDIRLQPA